MMGVLRLCKIGSIAALGLACAAVLLCNWSALGYRSLSVPTGSMRPHISPGSLVLVHRVPATSLKVGDVITYINPLHHQQTITHRIVKTYLISGRVPGFIVKGDANRFQDLPVSSGSIIGTVVWHAPHIGTWVQWSKSWFGIAILVYLPALLVMSEEVRRVSDHLRSKLPYKLYGYIRPDMTESFGKSSSKYVVATSVAVGVSLSIIAFFVQPALALLRTNTVALSHNVLTSAPAQTHANCSNNTNINVNNSSSQTAQTGSATGGSATSGNASNSNNTNININIKNGC